MKVYETENALVYAAKSKTLTMIKQNQIILI